MRAGVIPPVDLDAQIHEKDNFSMLTFKRLYNIDFGPDPDVFDVIIDNSAFITETSIAASDRGIAGFHQSFQQAINAYL